MNTYTYTEVRQKLTTLLEQAAKYGEVRIKPQKRKGSRLAVDGIKTKLSRREILESIEGGRRTF